MVLKNSKIVIPASFVVLVAIFIALWFSRPNSSVINVGSSTANPNAPDKKITRAGSTTQAGVTLPTLTTPSSIDDSPGRQLARLYSSSTDKRKFFDEALRRPQDGGYFLASTVEIECGANKPLGTVGTIERKNKLVPIDAPDRAMRLEAIKKIHEPCAGFDTSPINFKLGELAVEGVKAGDPVFKVRNDLKNAFADNGDLSTLPGILKAASEANNPYVVQEALSSLVINANKTGLAINDHQVVGADAQALIISASLVACQFGRDCSSNSYAALQYCTGGDSCGSDLYELVRQNGLPPSEFNKAMTFHNQFVEMFRTGNFSGISVKPKMQLTK